MLTKKNIPNILSLLRLAGTICLLFTAALSPAFFVIFSLTAITDALDGFIARKLDATSEFGAKLDSVCDLFFYFTLFVKLIPEMEKIMPPFFWNIVASIAIIRLFSYIFAALKFHKFASLHTRLNKLTGFSFFLSPFVIVTDFAVGYIFFVCFISAVSTIEELLIHLFQPVYKSSIKTAFEARKGDK